MSVPQSWAKFSNDNVQRSQSERAASRDNRNRSVASYIFTLVSIYEVGVGLGGSMWETVKKTIATTHFTIACFKNASCRVGLIGQDLII